MAAGAEGERGAGGGVRRTLSVDAHAGVATELVRFRSPQRGVLVAGADLYVLAGEGLVNGEPYGPNHYLFVPPAASLDLTPIGGPTTVLAGMFGPAELAAGPPGPASLRHVDVEHLAWSAPDGASPGLGSAVKWLRRDERGVVFLSAKLPGWRSDREAPILPDRVIAPGGGLSWVVLAGADGEGRTFQEHMVISGGMGASQRRDGLAACGFPAATATVPVGVIEARSPVVIERKEYVGDSGGPGRQRGGLGQRVVIGRAPGWSGTIRVSASLDHDRFPPEGILGGGAGAPSRFGLLSPDGTLVPSHIHQATLHGDARLVVEVAGGGGYGDPADRSPDAIAADLQAGYVTDPISAKVDGG